MNATAANYNPLATVDNGTCTPVCTSSVQTSFSTDCTLAGHPATWTGTVTQSRTIYTNGSTFGACPGPSAWSVSGDSCVRPVAVCPYTGTGRISDASCKQLVCAVNSINTTAYFEPARSSSLPAQDKDYRFTFLSLECVNCSNMALEPFLDRAFICLWSPFFESLSKEILQSVSN